MSSTLFGGEGQVGHKPKRASYPPPPWLVRRLRALGVADDEFAGKESRWCFALADRLERERRAEGRPTAADDPDCQGPDGWPEPERAAMGADLLAAVGGDTLTRERVLSLVENTVQCLTRAQLYRVARGLGKMLTEGCGGTGQ